MLVGSRLKRSQQCALAAKRPVKRGDHPAAFSVGVASPRALCAVLGLQFKKDVKVLVCIQRRVRKLGTGLEGMSRLSMTR